MPTRTSYTPARSSVSSSTRRRVSTSEWEVAHAHAGFGEEVGELLGHALGERRDEHPLVALGAHADLLQKVVDLALRRLDHDLGIDEAGRSDDLLDHTVGDSELVLAGRRGEVDGLADAGLELIPLQRPVVERARQPEPVLDERALAGGVALVHGADLRHGHMRLVDHDQVVIGEVVEQAGRLARRASVDVRVVVLDSGAEADLLHHLEVERRAHAELLRLEQLALALEPCRRSSSSSRIVPIARCTHRCSRRSEPGTPGPHRAAPTCPVSG